LIYAAFTVWLFLIIFMGMGVYRLWTQLVRPAWVNWALLPGTVVSEMAYIFGSLITGGEIRRAKLIDTSNAKAPAKAGSEGGGSASGPGTEATPKLKFIGPAVASLLAIVACGAAIVTAHSYLGQPVIATFKFSLGMPPTAGLPQELPLSWQGFWDFMVDQVRLLQRTCETWTDLKWLEWRVPLFVYLAACLSIRLAPARREVREMLAAAVLVAAGIGIAGLVSDRFSDLMHELWPLVTYVWASLLFLLVLTLLIKGVVFLVAVLAGKKKKA
jgi:hypothetical protein